MTCHTEYTIILSDNVQGLGRGINAHLAYGWKLHGSHRVATVTCYEDENKRIGDYLGSEYTQALTRTTEED